MRQKPPASHRLGRREGPAQFGYGLGAVSKPLFALAGATLCVAMKTLVLAWRRVQRLSAPRARS